MKIRQQVRRSPTATAIAGTSVRVRKEADDSTLTVLTTDSAGFVEYIADGHPGPFDLYIAGQPGGDKIWSSYDAKTVGPVALPEVPAALFALGDGVIRGYLNALLVSAGSGNSVTVATGGALVYGHPVINYTADTLSFTRPAASPRIDRVVVRLYPGATTYGKAEIAVLAGTEGGAAPALTQTTTVYEVSLAQLTIPTVAPITITDERTFSGERSAVQDEVRVATISTASAGGAALSGLSLTLDLPQATTYEVEADVTAAQDSTAPWVLQATYGGLGSGATQLNTPGQIGVGSLDGRIYVADAGNRRIVILNADGTSSALGTAFLTSWTGISVIPGTHFYVACGNSNSTAVPFFLYNPVGGSGGFTSSPAGGFEKYCHHVWSDGTLAFITRYDTHRVHMLSLVTGTHFENYLGNFGGGNAQFSNPWGITGDAATSTFYVVDANNNRVQKFVYGPSYVTQWAIPVGCRGCALDTSGNVLVACYTDGRIYRYTNTGTLIDSFATGGSPEGVTVGTGDVVYVTDALGDTIGKWDQVPGHGQVAIEIDGVVSDYLGIGDRDGTVANAATGSKAGPSSVVVRAFGKATSGSLTLNGATLSARAIPRR
jgi:hypothetical protein